MLAAHLGNADAEAVLLHALVGAANFVDGLRTEALRSLERFSAHRPEVVPTALLREAADLRLGVRPGRGAVGPRAARRRGYQATSSCPRSG